jgi:hypothetical protein
MVQGSATPSADIIESDLIPLSCGTSSFSSKEFGACLPLTSHLNIVILHNYNIFYCGHDSYKHKIYGINKMSSIRPATNLA